MTAASGPSDERVVRLIGVYDADGTVRGELAYWFGARLGRRHCALCDITHGSVRPRREWIEGRTALPIPFDTYHRNDQPEAVRAVTDGAAPVVLAETNRRLVVLLEPDQLAACGRSVDALMAAIERTIGQHGFGLDPID